MRNLSYGNEFDLQDNDHARKTHFSMKGCEPSRTRFETEARATRKWIIVSRINQALAWRSTDACMSMGNGY